MLFDGGSLEHIFNAPVALTSYMRMVRPGGHLLLALPANNYCGHGMYQFSPEFFFSALSEQNGFTVERMIMQEKDGHADPRLGSAVHGPWEGSSLRRGRPAQFGERVTLLSRSPVICDGAGQARLGRADHSGPAERLHGGVDHHRKHGGVAAGPREPGRVPPGRVPNEANDPVSADRLGRDTAALTANRSGAPLARDAAKLIRQPSTLQAARPINVVTRLPRGCGGTASGDVAGWSASS